MADVIKKRVFSGAQPTGGLHLGNYLGALSVWAENQDLYDNIFCIVDLHALTLPEAIDTKNFRLGLRQTAALYVACGIDPKKSSIFIQSHISEHAELAWVLNCVTPVGWLERMTQYKQKSKQTESVGMGLFDYPVLMVADILLYDTNYVPVGEDQRQHIELARDVAQRFNSMFGDVFVIPEALIRASGARIMGLDDPEAKMSKSIGAIKEGHAIGILDTPDTIKKTVMRAVTDSGSELRFEHASPGVINLLTIYQAISKKSKQEIEAHFEGKGYGALKRDVADIVVETLTPVRTRYNELMQNPDYIDHILQEGAARIKPIASATYKRVKDIIGIG